MTSKSISAFEETLQATLPPIIILNPRKKIKADQISIEDLEILNKEKNYVKHQLINYRVKPPPVPIPKFPLNITWHPNTLCFKLETEPVEVKIWIWNLSKRSIYFNCCGLWEETARFGASWRCYPRTRIWLPPGLRAPMFVRATPREVSPVPRANAFMQIAAGHLRDNVTGYFSISIQAIFGNYVVPPMAEG